MKKALTALIGLALAACLVAVLALAGEKNALRREAQEAQRKNQVLQTLYDQAKEEWDLSSAALKAQTDALILDKAQLNLELSAVSAALSAAQADIQALTDAEKQAADALRKAQIDWDAQRAAAADRLSDVMSLLSVHAEDETIVPAREANPAGAPAPGGREPREYCFMLE